MYFYFCLDRWKRQDHFLMYVVWIMLFFRAHSAFLGIHYFFLVLLDNLANTVNSLMFTGNPILFSRGIIVLTASGLVHTFTYATTNWLIKSYKMLINEENFQHLLFKFKPKIIHTC